MTNTKAITALLRRIMHETAAGREAVQARGAEGHEPDAPTVLQGELLDLVAEVFGEYGDDTDDGEALAIERFRAAVDALSPDGRDHDLIPLLDGQEAVDLTPAELARRTLADMRYARWSAKAAGATGAASLLFGAEQRMTSADGRAPRVLELLDGIDQVFNLAWHGVDPSSAEPMPFTEDQTAEFSTLVRQLAEAAFSTYGYQWADAGLLTVRAVCDLFGRLYGYTDPRYVAIPGWRAARDLGSIIDRAAAAAAPPPRAVLAPEQLRDLDAAIALQERQVAELQANTGIDPSTDTSADVGPVEVLRAAARVAWRTLEQLRRARAGSPAEVPPCGDVRTTQALVAVAVERAWQRQRWGDVHDDGHDPFDWIELIRKRQDGAAAAVACGDDRGFGLDLIEIAALAVAGVEAMERCRARDGQLPVVLLDAPPPVYGEPVALVRGQLASLRARVEGLPQALLAELDAIEGVIVSGGAS